LTKLTFGDSFDQKLEKNTLPPNLSYLKFGKYFNQILEKDTLPLKLSELYFGTSYNKKIDKDVLPQILKILKFDFYFNQSIEDNPCGSIEDNPCGSIEDVLPKKIRELELGYYFDQTMTKDTLPKKLKKITLSLNYKHSLVGVLPSGLTEIDFSFLMRKDKPIIFIPGTIPQSVKKLTFPKYFNQNFIDAHGCSILPQNLVELHLNAARYNQLLINQNGGTILPLSLKKITFDMNNYEFGTRNYVKTYQDHKKIINLNFGQKQYEQNLKCKWDWEYVHRADKIIWCFSTFDEHYSSDDKLLLQIIKKEEEEEIIIRQL